MLRFNDYEVVGVPDGGEAVALYEQLQGPEAIAAVIMDITIPGGMGGKEAARKILDLDPEAKLVVASGYSNDPIMADYETYGFQAALAKPFTMRQLLSVLQQIL